MLSFVLTDGSALLMRGEQKRIRTSIVLLFGRRARLNWPGRNRLWCAMTYIHQLEHVRANNNNNKCVMTSLQFILLDSFCVRDISPVITMSSLYCASQVKCSVKSMQSMHFQLKESYDFVTFQMKHLRYSVNNDNFNCSFLWRVSQAIEIWFSFSFFAF